MFKYCLLIFTKNDINGAINNVRRFFGKVDEIVILDSSLTSVHNRLLKEINGFGAKIYHVIPTGYFQPLMTYALSKIDSDFVLQLDAEDEVSAELLIGLKDVNKHDAYALKRIAKPYNGYGWQVRIFRKVTAINNGWHHEMVKTNSKVIKLRKSGLFINHRADYGNMAKIRNYLILDILERPLTYSFLMSRVRLLSNLGKYFPDRPVSKYLLYSYSSLYCYYTVRYGSVVDELKHQIKYLHTLYNVYKFLDPSLLKMVSLIRTDIEAAGGPIRYLCFDNPNYIESLLSEDLFQCDGISVFIYLLHFRFQNGKCASSIPKNELKTNTLYTALMEAVSNAQNGKSSISN